MRRGKPWTRREFVTSSFTLAAALRLQQAAKALGFAEQAAVCKLAPEQETGPFYIAGEMVRSDIAEGKPGVPLDLRVALLDSRSCHPLSSALIEIWHCDAMGVYSGFSDNPMGPGGPGNGPPPEPPDFHRQDSDGPPPRNPTNKLTFLRGVQLTDADGTLTFRTIVPGYYMGWTNHIHFKVRIDGHLEGKTYAAGHISHTGQIFFPEEICSRLMRAAPYNGHAIQRTTQEEDFVFNGQNGAASIAKVRPLDGKDFSNGL